LLRANNAQFPTAVQVNTLISDTVTTSDLLLRDNISSEPHPALDACLQLPPFGRIEAATAYKLGHIYIQDPAARAAVDAADPKPGYTVIDACAAPGGKSFAAAIKMQNSGRLISCDIHNNKLRRISDGAKRLGISIIETRCADARNFDPELSCIADLVIADVPCSGFGVIRKKPEIRYKDSDAITGLPNIQFAILKNLSEYVRPGGTLLYSTCTILPEENEAVIEKILNSDTRYTLEPFETSLCSAPNGMVTLLPHVHGTDGFFISKLRRKL